MSQTSFQPFPTDISQSDHLPLIHKESLDNPIQKENEQIAHSFNEISQTSTQPEEPSLPTQEPLEIRITIPTENTGLVSTILGGNQGSNLAVQASFLRRVCAVLVCFTLWIVSTPSVIEATSMLETLSIITFCCFGYFAFENLYICVTVEDSHENLFNILDCLFIMYFFCVMNFHSEENLTRYILISSPCLLLVSLCLYLWKSQAKKREKIIIKLSYVLQASLIIAKVLGYVSFKWMEVLIPLRICLLGHQAYGLYTIIESLGKMIKQRNYYEMNGLSLVKKCLSISWSLSYYGLSSLVLGILLDICIQVDKEDKAISIGAFGEMAQYYCSFFFGYTLIFIKTMKILNINLNENSEAPQIVNSKRKNFSLKPQKKNSKISHFMKISPTYFVQVNTQEIDSNRSEIEEALCYICETNQPNMILMGCGHGGICKDCLLASMKKNDKCLQCRTPVQSVYQIKKEDESVKGAVEAYEAFCVVH